MLLELGVVRHGDVERRRAENRRVELVEGEALEAIGDLGADAAVRPALVGDHGAVGAGHALHERLFVERAERAHVDDLGLDALLGERGRGLERDVDHAAPGDDRDVFPRSDDVGFAHRDEEIRIVRDLAP